MKGTRCRDSEEELAVLKVRLSRMTAEQLKAIFPIVFALKNIIPKQEQSE